MSERKVGKKQVSGQNLQKLHSTLKSLLARRNGLTLKTTKPETTTTSRTAATPDVIYIRSKENTLIPKLSDEEVLAKHRQADEDMKQRWQQIIEKYENVPTQGDVVDLRSGEIVQDNGHLRSLTQKGGRQPVALDGESTKAAPDDHTAHNDNDEDDSVTDEIWKPSDTSSDASSSSSDDEEERSDDDHTEIYAKFAR